VLPELGLLCLLFALVLAVLLGTLPLLGAQRGDAALMATARPLAWSQLAFIGLAFAILANAFLANDFSVAYVAQNSNTLLPAIYKFTAVWGAHEGSLLLGRGSGEPPPGPDHDATACVGRLGFERFSAPTFFTHAARVKVDPLTGVVPPLLGWSLY